MRMPAAALTQLAVSQKLRQLTEDPGCDLYLWFVAK